MGESLKKRYETKRINMIREKVSIVDRRLLAEQKTAQMIVEAMDNEDLNKVSDLIDKLRGIKSPSMPVLSAAIGQAETELNKYTGGGVLTAAWTKMKGLVGIDNPVVKITTFANALERGFSQMPTIIKNNVGDFMKLETSKSIEANLALTVKKTGEKSDDELSKSPFTGNQVHDEESPAPTPGPPSQNEADGSSVDKDKKEKLKNVAQQMLKALSPGGIYGVFKRVPYVDTKDLVKELLTVPINVLAPIIKKMQEDTKAADVATDLKDTITGQGKEETKSTETGEPTKATGQAEPRDGSGQKTDPVEKAIKMFKDTGTLEKKLKSHISDEDMKTILSALKDGGMLK